MTAEKNVFTTHLMENSVNGVVSKQGKLCRLKSQHDSLNNNKLYHHSLQTQRICVSIKHNSDTQMYISSLYFLLCWQIQQKDKSSATVLYVSLMALIKVIFPFYPWADLFSHSFFFYKWNCSELLIDLSAHYNADLGQDEIKGCRQLPYSRAIASWLEERLLWVRFMLSNRCEKNETRENAIWVLSGHWMTICIKALFNGNIRAGWRALSYAALLLTL